MDTRLGQRILFGKNSKTINTRIAENLYTQVIDSKTDRKLSIFEGDRLIMEMNFERGA